MEKNKQNLAFSASKSKSNPLSEIIDNPASTAIKHREYAKWYSTKLKEFVLNKKNDLKDIEDYYRKLLNQSESPYNKEFFTQYSECTSPTCLLSRRVNPDLRENFEQDISNKIVTICEQNKVANVVMFGTGDCFSEMRMILLALQKCPQATINVSFIDIQYRLFTLAKHVLGLDSSINSFNDAQLSTLLNDKCISIGDLSDKVRNYLPDGSQFNDEELEHFIRHDWVISQTMHQEFVQRIQESFPQPTFNLQVFGGYEEYLHNYLKDPDILTGIDFHDNNSLLSFSSSCYYLIVAYALIRTNGECCNKTLQTNNNKTYYEYISIKENQEANCIKFMNMIKKICAQVFSNDKNDNQESIMNQEDLMKLIDAIIDIKHFIFKHP